ncbi:hypothetical protein [Phenylobacterium sp.]|uniref:hypothetical protein n=1 Tax=Phenylobacterium sp. TaxID=1871053 RepID=UPI001222B2FC|nr:hypothetical protein [Phenylobacterium sp.]THD59082.1 MAG: hypothetical protein E8A12_11830 [Phenylobacterium sp.]
MDGADPIEVDELDPLSDAAVARLRADPRFREAAESFAAEALREFERADEATRWLQKDLGRASLYMACAILDLAPEGLTVTGLAATAASAGVCSRGRVLAFIHYALDSGRLTLAAGPEPWIRRRLTLTPMFMDNMRQRLHGGLESAALVAPEIAAALPKLRSDAIVSRATAAVGFLLKARPELNRNPGGPLRQIFIARDGGMRVLQHLMLRQDPGRERLMQTAEISRADLSRRFGVSRTHITRLLADAEAAGALTLPAPEQVVFAPAFSDEVEAYCAGQLQVMRTIAQTLMSASPAA